MDDCGSPHDVACFKGTTAKIQTFTAPFGQSLNRRVGGWGLSPGAAADLLGALSHETQVILLPDE